MKKKSVLNKKQYQNFIQHLLLIKNKSTSVKGKSCKKTNNLNKICNPQTGRLISKQTNKAEIIQKLFNQVTPSTSNTPPNHQSKSPPSPIKPSIVKLLKSKQYKTKFNTLQQIIAKKS